MIIRMFDEDVEDVGPYSKDHILAAIKAAEKVFWDTISAHFPDITSGDVGPEWVVERECGNNWAVTNWLAGQLPWEEDPDAYEDEEQEQDAEQEQDQEQKGSEVK